MILAAGRGERLRPLTDSCPKPMVSVQGKPLMQYHVEKLAKAGFERIVVNHAWKGEQIEQHFGDGKSFDIEIVYSAETMALETGGGITKALPLLGNEPFFVVNGDIYCDFDFASLPTLASKDIGHLFFVENPDFNEKGDFSLDGDRVIPRLTTTYTFSGLGVYRPDMFYEAPEGAFPLPQLWRKWMDSCQISGSLLEGYWNDVGTVERLELLEKKLG